MLQVIAFASCPWWETSPVGLLWPTAGILVISQGAADEWHLSNTIAGVGLQNVKQSGKSSKCRREDNTDYNDDHGTILVHT